MALSVIASAKNNVRNNTQTTGVTVTHGFTLANGDVLYAFLGMGDDPGTGWVDSAGTWTQLANQNGSSGNDMAMGVMRKIITNAAGEPSTYTFRRSGNNATDNLVAIVVQVRGADPNAPEDQTTQISAYGTDDFTPDNVDITTQTNNAMVLVAHLASFTLAQWDTAHSAGAPNGYSNVNSENFDDNTNTFSLFLEVAADTDVGNAGTQNIGSWTGTGDAGAEYITAAVAVKPYILAVTAVDPTAFSDTDTGIDLTGTLFGASQGNGKVELGDNATYASANLEEQTVTSWSDTAITITAVLGTLTPGSLYLFVTNNSAAVSAGFAVTVHRAHEINLAASTYIPAGGSTATTAQLTAPTGKSGNFTAGKISDDTNPVTVDIDPNYYTELEWAFKALSSAEDTDFDFRVTIDGTVLDTYTVTPTLTIASSSVVNLSASITGASATPTGVTSSVIDRLSATIVGTSNTPVATTSTVLRKLSASITGSSVIPDTASTILARHLQTSIAGNSASPDNISASLIRRFGVSVSANSITSDISSTQVSRLNTSIAGASTTSVIISTVLTKLISTITGISVTSENIISAVQNRISVSITGTSVTPDSTSTVQNKLSTSIAGVSLTPDTVETTFQGTITLIASITGTTNTGNVTSILQNRLAAALTGNSITPNVVSTTLERHLLVAIQLNSNTPAIISTLESKLTGIITGSSTIPDITSTVVRRLSVSITGQSNTPDDVTTTSADQIFLNANISGTSITPDTADSAVQQRLAVNISSTSSTAVIISTVERRFARTISGITVTPDINSQVERHLIAPIHLDSSTPNIISTVIAQLQAQISAVSQTPENVTTTVAGEILLSANIVGISVTPNVQSVVEHQLLASVQGNTTTAIANSKQIQQLSAGIIVSSIVPDTVTTTLISQLSGAMVVTTVIPDTPITTVERYLVSSLFGYSFAPNNIISTAPTGIEGAVYAIFAAETPEMDFTAALPVMLFQVETPETVFDSDVPVMWFQVEIPEMIFIMENV